MPHSIIHGDACFAYLNKIRGIPFPTTVQDIELAGVELVGRQGHFTTHRSLANVPEVRSGSCVTSIAGPHGNAQLYER
jgi:hypothetical protein